MQQVRTLDKLVNPLFIPATVTHVLLEKTYMVPEGQN